MKIDPGRARRSVIILLACASVLLLFVASSRVERVAAQATAAETFICIPDTVAVFNTRVHVRCQQAAPGGIYYFAFCNKTDSATASRFLSVFTTAKATGKNLRIYYTPSDTSGTACGCQSNDCRVIWGAEVLQ